jgi:hypothetical protein
MSDTGSQNLALESSPAGPPDQGRRRRVDQRIRVTPANRLVDDLPELERLTLGLRTRLISARSASEWIGREMHSLALRARNRLAPLSVRPGR